MIVGIQEQSSDIAIGVEKSFESRQEGLHDPFDETGAGDQGMMIGYACTDTEDLMPLPIAAAHRMAKRLADVRRAGILPYLRPDGKSQVTIEYQDGMPKRVHTVVISAQHREEVDLDTLLKPDIEAEVIEPVLREMEFEAEGVRILVNPTGRFEIGGPKADTGLTGRKIMVDSYGSMAPHGGGCFSGKDPTKVDRSAAYMGRYAAKNIVAAGLADRCQLQVAYAIGASHPVSLSVETFGTNRWTPEPGGGRPRGLRLPSGGDHPEAGPAPADLPGDRRVRPLRAQGLLLGGDRPRRRPPPGLRVTAPVPGRLSGPVDVCVGRPRCRWTGRSPTSSERARTPASARWSRFPSTAGP